MHRRPQRRHAHQEVAVAEHRDRQPARCRASASAAPTAIPGPPPMPPPPSPPSSVERVRDLPVLAGPGERACGSGRSARDPTASRNAAASIERRDRLAACRAPAAASRLAAVALPARRARLQQRQDRCDRDVGLDRAGADRSAAGPGNPCSSRCGRGGRARRGSPWPPTGSAPHAALNAPARSTQSRLRIASASRISAQASALGLLPAGGPCSLWRDGKVGAGLGVGQDDRAERLGEVDARAATPLRRAPTRPTRISGRSARLQHRGGFGERRRDRARRRAAAGSGRRSATAAGRRCRLSCKAASRQT